MMIQGSGNAKWYSIVCIYIYMVTAKCWFVCVFRLSCSYFIMSEDTENVDEALVNSNTTSIVFNDVLSRYNTNTKVVNQSNQQYVIQNDR